MSEVLAVVKKNPNFPAIILVFNLSFFNGVCFLVSLHSCCFFQPLIYIASIAENVVVTLITSLFSDEWFPLISW